MGRVKDNKMTKVEKDELVQEYEMYSKELYNYKAKAKRVGYKCEIPKLPKREQQPELLRSTITGFIKRFSNWKLNFTKFEDYKTFEQQERD